ncbi:helix-turn-helix transcriptional regulator [Chitiniphilus purpureus]|uniref:Helix-turn-helix transcriptional regulator n=1 Tax=Chitiniphilus purpureus TaxID=2981137 RepID=A0ABY6DLT8_9NEIS|nr:S24 family peptidase [Chitiniphilus sp. CD1]UXY14441.1 helix-turn-helix transcriptional regulator [Chitiniphilus sp. CD1]
MKTYSERLSWAMHDLQLTRGRAVVGQTELARAVAVKPQSIQYLCDARNGAGGSRHTPAIARYLGVSAEWLATGQGDAVGNVGYPVPARTDAVQVQANVAPVAARPVTVWDNEDELDAGLYVFIPRLNVKAACGSTGTVMWEIDHEGQRNAFRRRWAERLGIRPENSATIVAEGDSMEPRICDGDSLVIDYKQTAIQDGKVYALSWQGEFFVKRLYKEPGGVIVLHSDNEAKHPERRLLPEHLGELQIIGRVVAVSGGV